VAKQRPAQDTQHPPAAGAIPGGDVRIGTAQPAAVGALQVQRAQQAVAIRRGTLRRRGGNAIPAGGIPAGGFAVQRMNIDQAQVLTADALKLVDLRGAEWALAVVVQRVDALRAVFAGPISHLRHPGRRAARSRRAAGHSC
jgi:stage V sporulation protein SpoVS